MSRFDEALKRKGGAALGTRQTKSDEALGVNLKDVENILLADVKIDSLEINPFQPRTSMDEEKLEELKNSILERGLLQPIVVCPLENNPKRFQIIAGHRRTEAMKRLKNEFIPAIIVKNQSQDLKIDSLIENIQRDDLSPFDVAFAVKRIIDETDLKQVDVAKMLGKTKGYVSQLLKLCELPSSIIEHQRSDSSVPLTILTEISYLEDDKTKIEVFEKVCENSMSRAEIREYLNKTTDNVKKTEKIESSSEKESKPFMYKSSAQSVSFKLDLNEKSAYSEAIEALEQLLKQLKSSKV